MLCITSSTIPALQLYLMLSTPASLLFPLTISIAISPSSISCFVFGLTLYYDSMACYF